MASSEYLAGPPGACCLKATLHKGEPRGTKIPIAGVDTYIARPKDPGHSNGNIILYFPDVYGFWPNNFLTMDAMADGGYTVMALDYFRGVRFFFFPCQRSS
jgi:dienelactone hydrolase